MNVNSLAAPSEAIRVHVALGSNLGDRAARLDQALKALERLAEVSSLDCSPWYETAPMGPTDQPAYLNAVCRFWTSLSPLALLERLQRIEAEAGRRRPAARWSARTLDLDLLLYGDRVIDVDRLRVPHPGLHERSFVLRPLLDLDPTLEVPGVDDLRARLELVPDLGIRPYRR